MRSRIFNVMQYENHMVQRLFPELLVPFVRRRHAVHDGAAEARGLQSADAGEGAAAGGADRVLQLRGVALRFQIHLRRARRGPRGVVQRLGLRHPAGGGAVGQRVQEHVEIGRAAAGKGARDVHEPLLQRVGRPAGLHVHDPVRKLPVLHLPVAAVRDDAHAHRRRRVGHDADDRQGAAGEGLHGGDLQPRAHADEQGLSQRQHGLQRR